MDTREDSIPFSFTPDGLDEAAIDALIGDAYTQVNDAVQVSEVQHDKPADFRKKRPARRRASRRSARSTAA